MTEIVRGQIWWFDPEPTKGREQGKKIRPCVVLSDTVFNNGPAGIVIVIPCTTTFRKIPCHIELSPKIDGVKTICYAMCEQIRAIDKLRLKSPLGTVGSNTLVQIERWVSDILNLN